MKNNLSSFILFVAAIYSLTACAQTKKASGKLKSGTGYASVVLISTDKNDNGTTAPHIIIKWKSTQTPATFYWRGEDGWTACEILSAKKTGDQYVSERIALDKIKKNTFLQVTPVYGGKYSVPAEIPENSKNTLFFKTAKTGWLSLPVKK